MSGHKPAEILAVQPDFIKYAGIAASLTPGRNNGFLNMLNVIKQKTKQLAGITTDTDTNSNSNDNTSSNSNSSSINSNNSNTITSIQETRTEKVTSVVENPIDVHLGGPVAVSIQKKLALLKPTKLEIVDDSSKHAGHQATNELRSGETHFTVTIVADCFNNLSRVQRHQMVYTLLKQELSEGVHALSINAKTPQEM